MQKRHTVALPAMMRGAVFGAIWLVLTGASVDGLVFGALAVPGAVWLSLGLLPPGRQLLVAELLTLVPKFLLGSVRGGIDVAWRSVRVPLPIAPGWIVVPVALPDAARVALGAELSLMPGTLVAGAQDGKLLVHVLDRHADHAGIAATQRDIAAVLGRPQGVV